MPEYPAPPRTSRRRHASTPSPCRSSRPAEAGRTSEIRAGRALLRYRAHRFWKHRNIWKKQPFLLSLQVGDARQGIELAQVLVPALLFGKLGNQALRVIQPSKLDGVGGTSLCAG